MLKIKIDIFLKITLVCCLELFCLIFNNKLAQAQLNEASDISREIEKNLLFDKETEEKFDVYNSEYGKNKVSNPTFGSVSSDEGEEKKDYKPEEMNIILVDKIKIDRDLREKEKLAYNSVLIGQYENALELYKEILKKEPQNSYIKYSIAVVYQKLNQFKQAKNIYHELLKSGVDNKDEVINNIISIMVEEAPREAIYFLSRLTLQNPNTAYLFANIGSAYEKISNYNSAITNYVKAYQLDNNNPNYCYNLGVLYDQNKDYEKALEMYMLTLKNSSNSNSEIAIDLVKKRIENIKKLI